MRSTMVVVLPPIFRDMAGFVDVSKPILIETFVSEFSVEFLQYPSYAVPCEAEIDFNREAISSEVVKDV